MIGGANRHSNELTVDVFALILEFFEEQGQSRKDAVRFLEQHCLGDGWRSIGNYKLRDLMRRYLEAFARS
jgi:hypothetical protein